LFDFFLFALYNIVTVIVIKSKAVGTNIFIKKHCPRIVY